MRESVRPELFPDSETDLRVNRRAYRLQKKKALPGETNNLIPRNGCIATGGSSPYVKFIESN
jgi:hypothetical protein